VKVVLSEFALAGLAKCEPDEERKGSIESSMRLHLRHPDAAYKSTRLQVPIEADLFLFPLWKYRIVWQLEPDLRTVWSVSFLKNYKP
jgi:hypothetical protein